MKKILIVTGGSGGHVIPALSIYEHLKDKFDIKLITDSRGKKFINENKYHYTLLEVPNLLSNLYLFPINFIKFILSIFKSYFFLKKENINCLISTGGYMSLPICIASKLIKIKIFLFEPNCVLGKANNFMLSLSKKIICYDENIKLFPKKYLKKIYLISPILRKEFLFLNKNKKKEISDTKKILIIGGSQGAKFFDKNITELILKISEKFKLYVNHQVFDKNEKYLIEKKYIDKKINYRLFNFDEKLFEKSNDYDLAITRSGATALSELCYLNIPFIAIPFPFAKDDHQYFNAKFYESKNSCWLIRQHSFEVEKINNLITQLFEEKTDYFEKKKNLEQISNQNTWNNVNKKLIDLINEN